MAVAVYATDLSDITLAESGTFVELTGWTAGTLSSGYETDYFIQGTTCKSSSVKTTQSSIGFDFGSGITVPTDGAVLVWQVMFAPNSMDSYANGGMRVAIGNATTAFYEYHTGGLDRSPNPYGGWVNSAVNPDVATPDATTGAPSGTWQVFGTLIRTPTTYPSKGAPMGLDAIRYGRCELQISAGDSGTPANFTDMATKNDANDGTAGFNRWGLFSLQGGAFLNKGLVTFGSGSACYFVDANKVVNIQDTRKVSANFNTWSIENSSTVILTNCVISALGSVSKGRLVMVSATAVTLTSCLFKDMNTFLFQTTASISLTTFLRCGQITHGGATFATCTFSGYEGTADTGYLTYNQSGDIDGKIDGSSFTKGTASTHAIEFGTTAPITMTLRNLSFSGYNASNGNTDSTLYFPDKGSDVTWTINLIGCSGNISYKKARAGDTVSLVVNPVTLGITVKDITTQAVIENARVLIKVASGINFPYNASVSITGSGTTATVAHTGHGLATNDYIVISGANEDIYNGVYQITVTGVDAYTYTTNGTIGSSPATGTITATMAIISGLTNASGYIGDSRTYTNDQPITGWVRKANVSPFYVTQPINDTVDNVNGLTLGVQLIRDE